MKKHRRSFNKPKPQPKSDSTDNLSEQSTTEEIFSEETPHNLKSYISSISKYIYIIAAAALLSGIFTPFTINAEITTVVYGILTILLGLSGGILIFLATKNHKFSSIMVLGGSAIMVISVVIIYELVDRSLFS